ncbi:MAG: AMP-binding protein, partial [Myxococcota bacterium]|nr:AMP-binding protein [Myxococcota bacterium]
SAPLEPEILRFFWGAGLRILEVYGLSEACGISFANTVTDFRLGTVGRVVPGVECKQAEDGEILLRGDAVFTGYLHLEKDNAQVFDEEGYLRTGDIGEIDADGYLRITDRKKNLIKTAGGKYVVPARIQTFVKAEPIVGSVYIHGDLKPFVVALITVDEREIAQLAEELGVDESAVTTHPDVASRIETAVARANTHLAPFEQIKRHALLPEDFSIEAGTLTPTMKIKRRVVAEHYADVIDTLYTEATEAHRRASA